LTSRVHKNIIFTPFAPHQATIVVDKLLMDICRDLAGEPVREDAMGRIKLEVEVTERMEVWWE
jgi:hypothetical protein